MIRASDADAQFECAVNEVGGKFQAKWTAFVVAAEVGQSETDLRDFERKSDAWAWIYAEAARRGFQRIMDAGP